MTDLLYQSTRPVDAATAEAIRRSARGIRPSGGWWAEGINFAPVEGSSPLAGSTKLMLLGYESSKGRRQVEVETDMVMAVREAGRVARALSWWSLRHGIAWVVAIDGEPIGGIRFGVPSPSLVFNWVRAAVLVRVIARKVFLGSMRRAALEEFQDRWDSR